MKPDQERVRLLLSDTITLLCRNGLHFSKHLRLEGVLGVTVDDTDVFIVHINELLSEQLAPPALRVGLEDLSPYLTPSVIPLQQQLGPGPITVETTLTGKSKRDDGDGKGGSSKRHKTTELTVPAHQHHHHPNIAAATTIPQMPSPYIRCPTALLPPGKEFSDCRETLYAPVASNNPHDLKTLGQRGAKDDRSNARHQEAPHHGMTPTSGTILVDQWHFPKRQADRPTGVQPADPQPSYIQYGNDLLEGNTGADKKTSIFPQLSVLPMQFAAGVAMAAVDYNNAASTVQPPVIIGNRGIECSADGTGQPKIWGEGSSQLQQPQQNSTNERLVFDSLAGCSSWTVSQLMTTQNVMGTDEQHQPHDSAQTVNPMAYNQDNSNCTDLSGLGPQRGSKESRRSWTSKHKPHACQHPGCRKSYFFVHDLRRHLRQKHDGMDYNEASGRFEAAMDDAASQMGGTDCQQTGSPMTVHDTDDQSPDSDEETDALMAVAAHASNLDT